MCYTDNCFISHLGLRYEYYIRDSDRIYRRRFDCVHAKLSTIYHLILYRSKYYSTNIVFYNIYQDQTYFQIYLVIS